VTNSVGESNEEVFFACANGDLHELITCNARQLSLVNNDYDGRTPLHVAASNGHRECVRYLLVQAKLSLDITEVFLFVEATDCFGGTAIDDARREGHEDTLNELLKAEWNEELSKSLTL
jgi:ankyrin repeat protein